MMERLLLRDRAGPHGGLPGGGNTSSGNSVARDAVSAGDTHDDATAAAVGRRRMKSNEKETTVRHPAPDDVKAVRLFPTWCWLHLQASTFRVENNLCD